MSINVIHTSTVDYGTERVTEGEDVKLDAPYKLARAQLPSGEWLLRIELLDPAVLREFRAIVQRGSNTYDMQNSPELQELVDGVLASGAMSLTEQHLQTFAAYKDFQVLKEKVLPIREMKFHMMLGLAGELLELMQGVTLADPVARNANIQEELGDMLFCLYGIRRHYGVVEVSTRFADTGETFAAADTNLQLINSVVLLIDLVKRDLISEKPVELEALQVACWATEQGIFRLCKSLGIQMYQLADSNMAKLNKRYKDKFTAAEAAARADKAN